MKQMKTAYIVTTVDYVDKKTNVSKMFEHRGFPFFAHRFEFADKSGCSVLVSDYFGGCYVGDGVTIELAIADAKKVIDAMPKNLFRYAMTTRRRINNWEEVDE